VRAPLDAAALEAAVAAHPEGATIALRVVPRAPRTVFVGRYGDRLKLKVAAPPVDGAANAAVLAHVAGLLGVRTSAVTILSGERGRDKVVLARGVGADDVRAALGG
jgi:uncharacterized protein (TIGR00251 family)